MTSPNALPPRTIEVSGLACQRGDKLLFDGLRFRVTPGDLLMLRGPNGSGKTTLLMALAGIIRAEAGTITIAGRTDEDRPGADLHLLGHQSAIKPRLTVTENLRFWTDMFGGEQRLMAPALQAVGLADIASLEAGHLSAGQTRRLALARLLVADRPIWLLDEPTAALDGEGEVLVTTLLDAHLRRGGIAIAATHHEIPVPPPASIHTLMLGAPSLGAL